MSKNADKVRDEACLILSACASRSPEQTWYGIFIAQQEIGASHAAFNLAEAAYLAIPLPGNSGTFELECAEAECMLRDGWEIGDEIKPLPKKRVAPTPDGLLSEPTDEDLADDLDDSDIEPEYEDDGEESDIESDDLEVS